MHTYPEQEPESAWAPAGRVAVVPRCDRWALWRSRGYLHFLRNKDDSSARLDASSQKFGEVDVPSRPFPCRDVSRARTRSRTTLIPTCRSRNPSRGSRSSAEPDAIRIKTKKDRKKEREKPVERASVQRPGEGRACPPEPDDQRLRAGVEFLSDGDARRRRGRAYQQ